MIKKVFGDILSPPEHAIQKIDDIIVCHQVNCHGVMGAGLALQVRHQFPNVFAEYQLLCDARQPADLLGLIQMVPAFRAGSMVPEFSIANIFSQLGYGRDKRHTDYEAMEHAFEWLAKSFPNSTFRIPYRMGCGLGGGNWEIVEDIIHRTLCSAGINVEVWSYQ